MNWDEQKFNFGTTCPDCGGDGTQTHRTRVGSISWVKVCNTCRGFGALWCPNQCGKSASLDAKTEAGVYLCEECFFWAGGWDDE